MEIQVAHTADLSREALDAAHELLERAFEGDMTEHDWEHSLGGMHALAWEDGELVGHGSVVQRCLLHRGRALRTGYVEGVGVRADRRRRGCGAAVLRELERVIRGAYELGALGATDMAAPFYAQLGWRLWEGPTSVLAPDGLRPTPEADGAVWVLEVSAELDLRGELTCDWREGDEW
jgi:aminoglycoside 2'-N-acetyltransferase I